MICSLDGKVAIVTGAAHGIGRAIAESFAANGAILFLADLDAAAGQEVAASLKNATFIQTDVSDAGQVKRIVDAAIEKHRRIDALVNNAAYIRSDWHNVVEASEEEWDKSYRVTLRGASHFIQQTIPHMLPRKAGSIVNVSSVQGICAARSSAAYTAIKHGLVGLTRAVAYDYGPQNIRCNALCPGPIRVRYSPAEGSELYQRQISKTMLNRTGMPAEVAHAAAFLASDGASYITGAAIPVDGGWSSI
jgi:meso-butanediol dehydrogenase/(S,S)-butanediol dehydrogenase/diacetyl reductase